MSWLTRGKPAKLAVLAAVVSVAWLVVSRRREVWHTRDQGSMTGP